MAVADEVLSNKSNGHGQHPTEIWDKDFGPIPNSDLDAILNMPDDDMVKALARTNFKDDDERICFLRVIRRLTKYKLSTRIEFILQCLSSKLSMYGFGKTLQLQAKSQLIAPSLLREQLTLKKTRKQEDVTKSSDFRQEIDTSKEPKAVA